VWDSGQARDGSGATADFLAGLIGALPPVHELAQQAGIELPSALGRLGNQASNGEGRPVQAKAMAEPEAVATPRLEEEPPGQAEGPIG
jgi:flotillin